MFGQMSLQIARTGEGVTTFRTDKGPFTGMFPRVDHQGLLLGKSFITNVTLEWLNARVDDLVLLQVALQVEHFPADIALELLHIGMDSQMVEQVAVLVEDLITLVAFVFVIAEIAELHLAELLEIAIRMFDDVHFCGGIIHLFVVVSNQREIFR